MMQCKVRNFMNLYAYNLILQHICPSKVMAKFQNTFTPFSKHQGRPSWSENIVFCFLASRSFEGIMSLFHQPSYKIKRKFVSLTKRNKHYLTFNLNTSVFFQKFVCIDCTPESNKMLLLQLAFLLWRYSLLYKPKSKKLREHTRLK